MAAVGTNTREVRTRAGKMVGWKEDEENEGEEKEGEAKEKEDEKESEEDDNGDGTEDGYGRGGREQGVVTLKRLGCGCSSNIFGSNGGGGVHKGI